jgi:ABC-type antimicrobial peptide transport system permease subunit
MGTEIGIRMAIGANRSSVITLVLREIALVAAMGITVGTVAAVWIGKLAQSLVFEVEPLDPRVLGTAAVLLVGTALCAAWLPAWKAAQTDPMTVLRNE